MKGRTASGKTKQATNANQTLQSTSSAYVASRRDSGGGAQEGSDANIWVSGMLSSTFLLL